MKEQRLPGYGQCAECGREQPFNAGWQCERCADLYDLLCKVETELQLLNRRLRKNRPINGHSFNSKFNDIMDLMTWTDPEKSKQEKLTTEFLPLIGKGEHIVGCQHTVYSQSEWWCDQCGKAAFLSVGRFGALHQGLRHNEELHTVRPMDSFIHKCECGGIRFYVKGTFKLLFRQEVK